MGTWATERGRPSDKRQHKSVAPLVKSVLFFLLNDYNNNNDRNNNNNLVLHLCLVFLYSDVYFPDLSLLCDARHALFEWV